MFTLSPSVSGPNSDCFVLTFSAGILSLCQPQLVSNFWLGENHLDLHYGLKMNLNLKALSVKCQRTRIMKHLFNGVKIIFPYFLGGGGGGGQGLNGKFYYLFTLP